jgi:hypothetical protein
VLERHVNRDFDGDVMGLYRHLYEGHEYTFDLQVGRLRVPDRTVP